MRQRAVAEHVRIEATHGYGKPKRAQSRSDGNGHPGDLIDGHGNEHGGGGPNMAAMTKGCLAGSAICFIIGFVFEFFHHNNCANAERNVMTIPNGRTVFT